MCYDESDQNKTIVFNVYPFGINTRHEKLKLLYRVDFFFNLFYTIFFVFCFLCVCVHLYHLFFKRIIYYKKLKKKINKEKSILNNCEIYFVINEII